MPWLICSHENCPWTGNRLSALDLSRFSEHFGRSAIGGQSLEDMEACYNLKHIRGLRTDACLHMLNVHRIVQDSDQMPPLLRRVGFQSLCTQPCSLIPLFLQRNTPAVSRDMLIGLPPEEQKACKRIVKSIRDNRHKSDVFQLFYLVCSS